MAAIPLKMENGCYFSLAPIFVIHNSFGSPGMCYHPGGLSTKRVSIPQSKNLQTRKDGEIMRKTFYPLAALVVLLGLAALISAQEKSTTLTGYIVDKACSAGRAKAADPMAAASEHTRGCALMERCVASGFGVFADGKYYEFDQKGNELAKAMIEASKKSKGLKASVTGTLKDAKLSVQKIAEVD
jgi:hypothetical protein